MKEKNLGGPQRWKKIYRLRNEEQLIGKHSSKKEQFKVKMGSTLRIWLSVGPARERCCHRILSREQFYGGIFSFAPPKQSLFCIYFVPDIVVETYNSRLSNKDKKKK